jgi:hypothetical protein
MTKGKSGKGKTSKDVDMLNEAWMEFSKSINEKLMRMTKEGTNEYEGLYKTWREYVERMTQKLSDFSPEDKKAFKEMQDVWTDYSDKMGKSFVDLLNKEDGPYEDLYKLYSEYSERMGTRISELMRDRMKEQTDLYALWMDTFGMNDKDYIEGLSGTMDDVTKFWMRTWDWSKGGPGSDNGDPDFAARLKEINDFWTGTYSKSILNLMKSQDFAELNGAILRRNLETRQLNEKLMNQYLSTLGLPTKGNLDDIHRKLHELDRKVSEISRTIKSRERSSKGKGKK